MRFFVLVITLHVGLLLKAQFAPQVGNIGTTAIQKDSNIIINWAKGCVINRGWQNIADTTLGKAQVGDETYVAGPAGNGIVSLGDGGVATITFHNPLRNGNGPDFVVFENGFIDQTLKPGTAFLELAFVEVSSNGNFFVRFPAQSFIDTTVQLQSFEGINASQINNLAGKYIANYGTPFDLNELAGSSELNINAITHIRIIDVVGSIVNEFATKDMMGIKINDPWPTPFASSGFDLDAIGVIHQNGIIGLSELNHESPLKIFPMPASTHQIIHAESQPGETIEVYNALGKKVWSEIAQSTALHFSLDTPGTYTVRLNNHFEKLIIQ